MNTRALRLVTPLPERIEGLAIGSVLKDTYRIVRPLAEGGCGELYVARHLRLACQVAVKLLHRTMAGDTQAVTRFRREAEITSVLRHPNIVTVFDFDVTEQGVPFLVMELLDGRSLSDSRLLDTPLEPRAVLTVVRQVADALQAAHARGVVHRDLKPENVIVISVEGREDLVKVVDFGIASASWHPCLTGEAIIAGTPRYMSPEQARGQREEIDHRADQFSLAAMTYRMLTGREPFVADDTVALLHQVVHDDPRPPSKVAPWLDTAVDAVLGRAMAKRPRHRYPDMREFALALAEALGRAAPAPRPRALAAVVVAAVPPTHPDPPVAPAATRARTGRQTRRLIRATRRQIRGHGRLSLLLALAAILAFAWFCPATRDATRGAWRGAQGEARRLVEDLRAYAR